MSSLPVINCQFIAKNSLTMRKSIVLRAFRDRIHRIRALEGKKCDRQLTVVVLYKKKMEQNLLSKDAEDWQCFIRIEIKNISIISNNAVVLTSLPRHICNMRLPFFHIWTHRRIGCLCKDSKGRLYLYIII